MNKTYPYILMIGSIVGLLASFFLMLDTISLIKNPEADLPCNVNPFISCGNAILSEQGEVFGFPNPLLGIIAFSMLFAIGVMLFSGGRAKKPLWILANLGLLSAMIFVIWFFLESLYDLRSLCLYCMIVWIVTWPLFLYTTIWNFKENHFPENKKMDRILNLVSHNHITVLLTLYIIMIFMTIFQFRDFFLS